MKLKIHRGAQEIGGSCVELTASDGGRVLLDLGMPLTRPDGTDWPAGTAKRPVEELRAEEILPNIEGLYRGAAPGVLALLLSHAHMDHNGLAHHVSPSIPVYGSQGTLALVKLSELFVPGVTAPDSLRPYPVGAPLRVGAFQVTAIPVGHSAPDARALLVEADGDRVLYSGDLNAHGRDAALFEDLVRRAPRADVLLLEGTVMGQPPGLHGFPDEQDVEQALVDVIQGAPGLVVVVASGQNIDRIISAHLAARSAGRELVVDAYQGTVLHDLAFLSPEIPQVGWDEVRVKFFSSHVKSLKAAGRYGLACAMSRQGKVDPQEMAARGAKMLLVARSNRALINLLNKMSDPREISIVWSLWKGYWPKDKVLRPYCERHGITPWFIHSGGHAHPHDLKRLVDAIAPRAVVPIHTQHPTAFLDAMPRVRLVEDGGEVEVGNL